MFPIQSFTSQHVHISDFLSFYFINFIHLWPDLSTTDNWATFWMRSLSEDQKILLKNKCKFGFFFCEKGSHLANFSGQRTHLTCSVRYWRGQETQSMQTRGPSRPQTLARWALSPLWRTRGCRERTDCLGQHGCRARNDRHVCRNARTQILAGAVLKEDFGKSWANCRRGLMMFVAHFAGPLVVSWRHWNVPGS